MADVKNKYKENAKGTFYVDGSCIDCNTCRECAPKFFKRDDSGGHSFVFKQPKTKQEIEECQNALESCPANAIGSDGSKG